MNSLPGTVLRVGAEIVSKDRHGPSQGRLSNTHKDEYKSAIVVSPGKERYPEVVKEVWRVFLRR